MRQIAAEQGLNHSKAFQAFLVDSDKKDLGDKLAKKFAKMVRKEFKITEVYSFDEFFEKCAAPLDTVCELSDNVATAHETLSGLFTEHCVVSAGVQTGDMKALFTFYFDEMLKSSIKMKLKISSHGHPKLKVKGNSHAKHVANFVEALQTLVESIISFVQTAPDLVEQIAELATECQEFPSRIKNEAASMNPMKIPGATKKTLDNVKYLGGVPEEFKEAMQNIQELLGILQTCVEATFGPGDDMSD